MLTITLPGMSEMHSNIYSQNIQIIFAHCQLVMLILSLFRDYIPQMNFSILLSIVIPSPPKLIRTVCILCFTLCNVQPVTGLMRCTSLQRISLAIDKYGVSTLNVQNNTVLWMLPLYSFLHNAVCKLHTAPPLSLLLHHL